MNSLPSAFYFESGLTFSSFPMTHEWSDHRGESCLRILLWSPMEPVRRSCTKNLTVGQLVKIGEIVRDALVSTRKIFFESAFCSL